MSSVDGLDLGTFGIYTFDFEHQPAAQMRESVKALEEQGWQALWFPEVGGREALTHAAFLLSCTERMHIINGIAQIWARDPQRAYGASLLLADAYPGRHVLGLGVGRARPEIKPVAAMTGYLDELDALTPPSPAPQAPMHRILAAYGPRMLELARDRSAGAHTYHVNVAHTARAREILGPDRLLAPEQAVVLADDLVRGREIARAHVADYLRLPNYVANLRRLGFGDEELSGAGSARLTDALVVYGDEQRIAARVLEHLRAGADHVCIQVVGQRDEALAVQDWRRLAPALTAL